VIVPDNIESNSEWLERKSRTSYSSLFSGFSHSFPFNRAAGKEPSSSSGELWIDDLCRFISSGYTYQSIFLKKTRRNQKAYSITIVIDAVQRLFLPFNIHHTVSTITTLLGAFSLIPDSDDIVLDVVAASFGQALLLVHNFSVRQFSEASLISDLLLTIQKHAGFMSGIGSGCQIALKLASQRSGVGFGRRIILFTDAIITNLSEMISLRSALLESEVNGINVLTIGLGIAPIHLPVIFPVVLYSFDISGFSLGLATVLGVSVFQSTISIIPRIIFHPIDPNSFNKVQELLCKS
jgi:hypothetical protein